MTGPWTFTTSLEAAKRAALAQAAVEDAIRDAYRTLAHAQEAYAKALAVRILELHAAGSAWTVAGDLARGDTHVARLRRDRDIAEGVREATTQAAWRRAADRKDTARYADWSMRIQMQEYAAAGRPEPQWTPTTPEDA